MKWMNLEFDNSFSEGKRGFTQCWINVKSGGYLMMILEYKAGKRVNNLGKKWLCNKWMFLIYVILKLLSN